MTKEEIAIAYKIRNRQNLVLMLLLCNKEGIIVGKKLDLVVPVISELWGCNVERRGWGWLENIGLSISSLKRSKAFLQNAKGLGWLEEKKLVLIAEVDQPTFKLLA